MQPCFDLRAAVNKPRCLLPMRWFDSWEGRGLMTNNARNETDNLSNNLSSNQSHSQSAGTTGRTFGALPPPTTVAYRSCDGATLLADIYRPDAANDRQEPVPVVMWWSGGGWTQMGRGGGGQLMRWVVEHAGLALMTVDYRVAAPWQGVERPSALPPMLEDMQAAWRWLGLHAAQLNIDASRIFWAGDSAGGHLVSLCARHGAKRLPGVSNCSGKPTQDVT
jgi:acetyl esterase/lipase